MAVFNLPEEFIACVMNVYMCLGKAFCWAGGLFSKNVTAFSCMHKWIWLVLHWIAQLEAVPVGRAIGMTTTPDLFWSQANLPAFCNTEVPYIYDTYWDVCSSALEGCSVVLSTFLPFHVSTGLYTTKLLECCNGSDWAISFPASSSFSSTPCQQEHLVWNTELTHDNVIVEFFGCFKCGF